MNRCYTYFVAFLWSSVLLAGLAAKPAQADMLEECRALSTIPEDVQNCMDNFLDLLDNSINDIEQLILGELGSDAAAAAESFDRSQAAFKEFRRENCLWYLEFSTPREDAEQIAKNCLASMSQDRLKELQALVSTEPVETDRGGYYVYGVERNTLQLCGSSKRYWVEGDASLVGELQQDYLNQSVADLSLLYVLVQGEVDLEAGSPYPGHDGVFRMSALRALRLPADGDCQIPTAINPPVTTTTQKLLEAPIEQAAPEPEKDEGPQLEPEQSLAAYFGSWSAVCEQLGTSYGCVLTTPLIGNDLPEDLQPVLKLTRRSGKRTIIDLEFPDQEIDSINKILWNVDKFEVGPIPSSKILVDEISARQLIRERTIIQGDLLPLLSGGKEVKIVIEDNGTAASYVGTLVGLTRALSFADDFTLADGRL